MDTIENQQESKDLERYLGALNRFDFVERIMKNTLAVTGGEREREKERQSDRQTDK